MPEHGEQVAHAVGVAADAVVGARLVREPVAEQVGRDHGVAAGQRVDHRLPGACGRSRARGGAAAPGPEPALTNARRWPWIVTYWTSCRPRRTRQPPGRPATRGRVRRIQPDLSRSANRAPVHSRVGSSDISRVPVGRYAWRLGVDPRPSSGRAADASARGRRRLHRSTGALSTAATARMETDMPWFRELSAEDRSWVGLIVQAGIRGFVDWFRPERPATAPAAPRSPPRSSAPPPARWPA